MDTEPVACPCGCGARFPAMVAERERGLREDTLAVAPVRKLPGREHAAAYLISGVPGAGKSTVARLLALHFDRSAHIDIDMIYHHFTVAGLVQPTAMTGGTRSGRESTWPATSAICGRSSAASWPDLAFGSTTATSHRWTPPG